MSAVNILEKAASHLKGRAVTYDKPDGERSIGATVQAFNAITGDGLMNSEERGWLFMAILKMVRSQQGNYKADNYEGLAAYSAQMGEAACDERNGGWTPEAINEAAFKDAYKEYTLQEVLGGADVPDWVRWVVVTKVGHVVMCELEPVPHSDSGLWEFAGAYELVNKVVPPISFENCIWRVNK